MTVLAFPQRVAPPEPAPEPLSTPEEAVASLLRLAKAGSAADTSKAATWVVAELGRRGWRLTPNWKE